MKICANHSPAPALIGVQCEPAARERLRLLAGRLAAWADDRNFGAIAQVSCKKLIVHGFGRNALRGRKPHEPGQVVAIHQISIYSVTFGMLQRDGD
jgi:hypothetical protein